MNEEEAIWSVPVDYFRRNGGVPGWSDLFDKDVWRYKLKKESEVGKIGLLQ